MFIVQKVTEVKVMVFGKCNHAGFVLFFYFDY